MGGSSTRRPNRWLQFLRLENYSRGAKQDGASCAEEEEMKPYYQDESVTLYNGNCLELLNTDTIIVGAADALLTDPPFSFAGGISNGVASSVDSQFFLHWWKSVAPLIVETVQETGEGFIWCDWRSAPIFEAGFRVDQTYSWRRFAK
jgi:hypothetical protein